MPPKPPHVRLAFGRLFWRQFVLWASLGLFSAWRIVELRLPPGELRVAGMLKLAPRVLYLSLFLSTIFTILADLVVRFVVRPMVVLWHRPVAEPLGGLFQIEANEHVVNSVPARSRYDRKWMLGSLVLTNRSLWFFPDAWDVEPWTHRLGEVREIFTQPLPSVFLGLIRDLPEHLAVELTTGEVKNLIVADADEVVGWLPPNPDSQATRTPSGGVADSPTTSLERTA